jgi:hypothetical protein
MKKVLVLTAAAALLAGSAVAQDNREGMYASQDDSGSWWVFGPEGGDGMAVASTNDGMRPSDCPAGTYYEAANDQIAACDDDAMFGMMAPEAGSMMPSGEPWPEGAMMLDYRENN